MKNKSKTTDHRKRIPCERWLKNIGAFCYSLIFAIVFYLNASYFSNKKNEYYDDCTKILTWTIHHNIVYDPILISIILLSIAATCITIFPEIVTTFVYQFVRLISISVSVYFTTLGTMKLVIKFIFLDIKTKLIGINNMPMEQVLIFSELYIILIIFLLFDQFLNKN
ncbi:hypothetical protein BSQ39_08275 [Loigolactobacillus backii]|nr:hypothetical protein BSQ39_08275 [Loigolactobacillus backii]